MPNVSEKKSLLIILSVFSFVVLGTFLVSLIARGYRPALNSNTGLSLKATGLLSATSEPKSASVYLDNRLVTATDDTLNLSPGNYLLKIVKDGYQSWQKNISLKKEIVYQSNAQLFRSSPDLRPLTQSGALNPTISPDYSKIIYSVASASASQDNGLYLIELASNPLSLNKNVPRQISPNSSEVDWSKATFTFSPNSQQVLAHFSSTNINYLLDLTSPVSQRSLVDVTARLSFIREDWEKQNTQLLQTRLDRLPEAIRSAISTDSAQNVVYSSTDDKVLYLAATSSALPQNIITPPPAQSTQIQSREIQKDSYYVYDLKDDTNFFISSRQNSSHPFWLFNSNNLVFVENKTVKAVDYDGTNRITLFAGNFNDQIVLPSADGNKIITLTSAYTGAPENLYAVTIR